MKKFISLIALVGVFAACEPENLQTAFNVGNATATINVTVVSAAPGFDQSAAQVTYAWSNGGTTQSIEGNPSIAAGTVTVTATFEGAKASETISFPQIFAGMDAVFTATVFIPYNAGGYTLSLEKGETETFTTVYGIEAAAHGHGYKTAQTVEFNGKNYTVWMMENASEFILEDSYTWTSYEGFETYDFEVLNDDFSIEATLVYAAIASKEGIDEKDNKYEFSVGAWSLYNVINPEIETTTTYYVIATPDEGSNNPEIPAVASFDVYQISSACGAVEIAHPDHASHYVPHTGHYTHDGHAIHGNNNNAGGGIIDAE